MKIDVIIMHHVSCCCCIGDDFPNAFSLLEAVLAVEEGANAPPEIFQGNALVMSENFSGTAKYCKIS